MKFNNKYILAVHDDVTGRNDLFKFKGEDFLNYLCEIESKFELFTFYGVGMTYTVEEE